MKNCGDRLLVNGAVAALCVMAAATAFAERQEYDRYKSIVDRQMFGPLPDGFDPTKSPSEVQKTNSKSQKELTKEQEQIKKSVRFSMININPKGETMVGFTDSSDAKNVRNYYLRVGESRDGWTVKSADAVAATVSISKDGVDLDLELGGSSNGGNAKGGTAGAAVVAGASGLRRPGPSVGGNRPIGSGVNLGSLRERRMARMQQREANEKAEAEDKAKREAEQKEREAREAEDKAQREAEREQQRQQLLQIQEELKKAREARQAAAENEKDTEKENAETSATSDE